MGSEQSAPTSENDLYNQNRERNSANTTCGTSSTASGTSPGVANHPLASPWVSPTSANYLGPQAGPSWQSLRAFPSPSQPTAPPNPKIKTLDNERIPPNNFNRNINDERIFVNDFRRQPLSGPNLNLVERPRDPEPPAQNRTNNSQSTVVIPDNAIRLTLDSQVRTDLLQTISNLKPLEPQNDVKVEEQEKICFDAGFIQKLEAKPDLDWRLKKELNEKRQEFGYNKMIKERSKLPTYKMRNEILNLLRDNPVIVLSGETGCGKTTQIAQIILDDAILNEKGSITKILCTQPRRISAVSVAERVAYERMEHIGKSVGYQVRFEKELCRRYGGILYCTSGILMQYMRGDESLAGFSHIILDEVHERTIDTDVTMRLLKTILLHRSDLHVILMSATLRAELFCEYFDNCPRIHIPGNIHPIEDFYLEDILTLTRHKIIEENFMSLSKKQMFQAAERRRHEARHHETFMNPIIDQMRSEGIYSSDVINELRKLESEKLNLALITELVEYICLQKPPGAILIFLPGLKDIFDLLTRLKSTLSRHKNVKCVYYALHSKFSIARQRKIFEPPPKGVRKIIASTSIAETSITIDDIVYVIDSGKIKLVRFDTKQKIDCLLTEWISKANGKQRRGRAGRVKPGECYKMYTRGREDQFEEVITPEILRMKLENVIMQIQLLGFGPIKEFMNSLIESPDAKAIDVSIEALQTIQVLDDNAELTKIGFQLAHLPLDALTGKMILWGAVLSCCDPIFSIAATLSYQDPYENDVDNEEELKKIKLEMAKGEFSDHIGYAECLRQFEKAFKQKKAREFCKDNYLSFDTLLLLVKMKKQFANYLYHLKLIISNISNDDRNNKNSSNTELIKSIVCAGLYPNIAIVSYGEGAKFPVLKTLQKEEVKIHPLSVSFGAKRLPSNYVTYYFKQKSTQIFLYDVSCVSQLALVFAAAKSFTESDDYLLCTINKFMSFWCNSSTGKLIQNLRTIFDQLFDLQIIDPNNPQWQLKNDYVRAIVNLLTKSNDPSGYESDCSI